MPDDLGVSVDIAPPGDWVGVVFGGQVVAPNGVLCLEDLNGNNGFRLLGMGDEVAAGVDMNKDGIDDLLVGTAVVFGEPGIGASGTVIFNFVHDGQHATWFHGQFTRGKDGAGDVNDDGIDDAIVGAKYDPNSACNTDIGAVHVILGRRMGDGDLDADVDFLDFGAFQRCYRSELDDPEEDPDVPDACHPFDFDKDNDVDADDFAAFQAAFGTPP